MATEARTEVRKPGGHVKQASVLLFPTPKNLQLVYRHFIDFLKLLPITPSNLIFCPGMPNAFRKLKHSWSWGHVVDNKKERKRRFFLNGSKFNKIFFADTMFLA